MDLRQDVPEINELHTEMITDFTNRLAVINSGGLMNDTDDTTAALSKPTYLALDFIYFNLHKKIALKDVAAAAPNMLLYSDYSESDISEYLAFSSASYFIKIFKEKVGMTPKEYQRMNFRHASFTSNIRISDMSKNQEPALPPNNT